MYITCDRIFYAFGIQIPPSCHYLPTRPPIKWVPGVKRLGDEGDHSIQLMSSENVYLYLHASPRLHGEAFNQLSIGTALREQTLIP
jgi:hypothetical protein